MAGGHSNVCVPEGDWLPPRTTKGKRMTLLKQNLLTAAFIGIAASALADWNPGDPAKWVQMPDLQNGMDVLDTFSPILPYNKILADDFKCTQTGPITSIHIWGSWLNDRVPRDGFGNPIPPVFD